MIETLYAIDRSILLFLNGLFSTPPGDVIWPLVTDYDKVLPIRIALIVVWLFLLVRGGVRGRTVALLLIPVILCADQLSSAVVKPLIGRPRPCHLIGGEPVVEGLRMLVGCGSGLSFPSSHAVNNFAVATLFTAYYRRGWWAFFAWASLVALSRPIVGVHYPSDILGGAIIGTGVALLVIAAWRALQRRFFPSLAVPLSREANR
jgi:undecaprenyl-diphosphatase